MSRILVVAMAMAVPLAAQTPPDRSGARAREMRQQIESGTPLTSHVRVSMRLKNGNRLNGVVKDGRLFERVDGIRFVDASASDPGAGVRIWYSSGGRDYVFVPFAELAEYTVLQKLSAEQLAEIERELLAAERKAAQVREQTARQAEARQADAAKQAEAAKSAAAKPGTAEPAPNGEVAPPAGEAEPDPVGDSIRIAEAKPPAAKPTGDKPTGDKPSGDKPTGDKPSGPDGADKAQQQQWFALLQDYPVSAGWGKAKRDEIARRFVVVGARPSEKEQRFVDRFADWQKACEHFGVKEGAAGEAGEAPPTERGRNTRRR